LAILLDRYRESLKAAHREMICADTVLDEQGFLARRKTSLEHCFAKTGLIRNMGLF
jgi:hypothetical protein